MITKEGNGCFPNPLFKISRVLKRHQTLFNDMRDEYEKSTTTNIAKSIHEGEGGGGGVAENISRAGRPEGNAADKPESAKDAVFGRGQQGSDSAFSRADQNGGRFAIASPETANYSSSGTIGSAFTS